MTNANLFRRYEQALDRMAVLAMPKTALAQAQAPARDVPTAPPALTCTLGALVAAHRGVR